MNLEQRIDLLTRLGDYMKSNEPSWEEAKQRASYENGWFIPEFVKMASQSIAGNYLRRDILEKWVAKYKIDPNEPKETKLVGIVMAGNIPLVGFHDLLSVFISGHRALIKPSSKDNVLIRHLVEKMAEWNPEVLKFIQFADSLNNCDAYIATGSNNSAGYFEYYFKKYPHIIRRNRTSVAVLTGEESKTELEQLADDVYLFFGLGCRNVTKIFVPQGYDFIPLLTALKKYDALTDHHKYKNNYDYNLAILLLNKKVYMSSGSVLLVEESSPFSPIAVLNYEHYDNKQMVTDAMKKSVDIQCIVGQDCIQFGRAQSPGIDDYADGVDTLAFLANL